MAKSTPVRVRLSLSQKVKIIEDSKKAGFERKNVCLEYGINKATLSCIFTVFFLSWTHFLGSLKNSEQNDML